MRVAFCPGARTNPFFERVLDGVSARLREKTGDALVQWQGNERVPLAALKILGVDGFLAGPLPPGAEPPELVRVPRVGFSHFLEALPWDRVVNDDSEVGWLAAAGLAEAGYSNLACLGGATHWHMSLRIAGVRAYAQSRGVALRFLDANLPPPRPGETFPDVYARHEKNLRSFLATLPANTGLVCLTQRDANQALEHLRVLGRLQVPEEVGLILADLPFDHTTADVFAYVALDGERVGREAVDHLLEIIAGRRAPGHDVVRVPPLGIVPGESLRSLPNQHLLPRIQAYCRERLAEKIRVEDIARHIGMSRRSLEMKLREQGLPSPHELLLRLRLDAAKERLAGVEEGIEAVAEACGLGEARALARHFRRRFGTTPRQFRLAARRFRKLS